MGIGNTDLPIYRAATWMRCSRAASAEPSAIGRSLPRKGPEVGDGGAHIVPLHAGAAAPSSGGAARDISSLGGGLVALPTCVTLAMRGNTPRERASVAALGSGLVTRSTEVGLVRSIHDV